MKIKLFYIDTFTSIPFSGNPTSVGFLTEDLDDSAMLSISNELNLPVTAFIKACGEEYKVKYFTPTTEIPACGHATLASAKVINLLTGGDFIKFRTINNIVIEASVENDLILMKYPRYDMKEIIPDKKTLKGLGISNYKSAGFSPEIETLFLVLDDPAEVKNVNPSYPELIKSSNEIKEVVITSFSDNEKYDYILRSFCPWIGIDEDPVTGSVHSVLGPFWKDQLNKDELNAFQASKRGGELLIKVNDDNVQIGGSSVIIMEGELNLS